ncbi:MAG: CapA family protein [Synergistaceae bacterium]|jgi:poly-gamma-glutamate synthesis protein (capsule biosynthesis protein)|nr:CapA family protein [Synergistaceae bacterium]
MMKERFWASFLLMLCAVSLARHMPPGAAEASPRPAGTVRVVFIGDIMAHAEQLEGARRGASWDFSPQFRRVKPLFHDALAAGNLETVFAGERKKFAGYPSFNTPDELASAVLGMGVSVVTLANNHILDRGVSGAKRTTEVLDEAGISWTGLAYGGVKPNEALLVEYGGLRWAFVNFSYGSNTPFKSSASGDVSSEDVYLNIISDEAVKRGLESARALSPDMTAAFFHWGNEYQFVPTKRAREIASLCVEGGANIVIGTHPHVLQPIEVTSSDAGYALVAYSLGNFVSHQRAKPRERSVVLAVDVARDGERARISRVSVAPTWVSSTGQRGHRLIEVVYAGSSDRFNHAGLNADSLRSSRIAGAAAIDFLGAAKSPDAEGFYTIWDESSPDILPKSRRKTPE